MKKYAYTAVLLFSLALTGCSDTNVFTPTVENPNVNWQLEHKVDFFQTYTTNPIPESFTKTFVTENGETLLYIRNVITTDSKTSMKPSAIVTNNGKSIELTYRDESPTGTTSLGAQNSTEMRHYFFIRTMGKGSGSNIQVTTKYLFPNPNLGVNRNESRTLTF
jgi:hypothetical protein